MKQLTIALAFLLCFANGIFSQTVPSGMKYQAVARNLKGDILAGQTISLQVSLGSQVEGSPSVYYTETHDVVTNQLGLFDLVIGAGKATKGTIKDVPWSTEDIWMQIAIKDKGSNDFSTISNSKLLAVPYAFYAVTASELLPKAGQETPTQTNSPVVPPENSLEDPIDKCDAKKGVALMRLLYLGTSGVQIKVYQDDRYSKLMTTINNVNNGDIILVDARTTPEKKFKSITYLMVGANGPVSAIPTKGDPNIVSETYGSFSVMAVLVVKDKDSNGQECTVCDVQQEWKTGGNVTQELCGQLGTKNFADLIFITNNIERLRITANGDINLKNNLSVNNSLNILNNVDIGNDLTVKNNVRLNTVGGTTIINGPTTIEKMSPTALTGTLTVDKATNLKSTLNAIGATTLGNTLGVTGATTINNTLNATGATTLASTLGVAGATTINNTLNATGAATLGSTLGVTGATTLNNTLNATGATTLGSTLGVTGATTINNTLEVTGATRLRNNVTTDGINTVTNTTESTGPAIGALVVAGGAGIGKNLSVGGSSVFSGGTAFSGAVNIANTTQSDSKTTGALVVAGGAGIGKNLNVGGATNIAGDLNVNTNKFNVNGSNGNTAVSGALSVQNATTLRDEVTLERGLRVAGSSNLNTLAVTGTTTLSGFTTVNNNLDVASGTRLRGLADLNSTLNVDGKSRFRDSAVFDQGVLYKSTIGAKGINVTDNNANFVSTFENTNNGNGDGIKIKLGKTHPMWNNGSFVHAINYSADQFQNQIDVLRGWIIDHNSFTMSDLATLAPSSLLTGTVISIANKVSEKINTSLNLPIYIGPYSTPAVNMPAVVMPAVNMPKLEVPGFVIHTPDPLPNIDLPGFTVTNGFEIFPQTTLLTARTLLPATEILPRIPIVPALPQLPNPFPSIDLKLPNLATTDVTNSLTNENEFIRFVDKDDRMLGSIRAQSINDFGADYFDGVYFVNVMASLVGIDLVSGFMGGIAEFTNLIDDYNNIGVEYSSGHGDYAEWLPRMNKTEMITSGDIVGVKGGKITKDLSNAEQVMAVSYRPIMLGNAPSNEEEKLGNKIAFLGQIPVKVMGAVNMGDFIVGKSNMPGYGVAINPSKVTPHDLALSVGRAWETNTSEGPKLINTLIGIQNGDYLNILKRSQEKIETMETRLSALEKKMTPTSNKPSNKKK